MWSIGNENTMTQGRCGGPDNVTPVLRRLQQVAKAEDPGRVTTLADLSLGGRGEGKIKVSGITDIWGLNRYYMWYYGDVDGLVRDLDGLHATYPRLPVGISEYGAGAALGDHTDNPLGGPPTPYGSPGGRAYQPEEYAAYVHERNYEVLASRPFVWGTYVWAMFDFGSGIRNEGDLRGVNTKGLVTFDRQTRKDPVLLLQGELERRAGHAHRRSALHRSRVRHDRREGLQQCRLGAALVVNGAPFGTKSAAQCPLRTCVFERVVLQPGKNVVAARGTRGGDKRRRGGLDTRRTATDVNIAAGQLATGLTSSDGKRYGSDNFFTGGSGRKVNVLAWGSAGDTTPISGVAAPADAELYSTYRAGRFRYDVPLANGTYQVAFGFVEPSKTTTVRPARVRRRGERHEGHLRSRRAAGGGGLPHGGQRRQSRSRCRTAGWNLRSRRRWERRWSRP